METRGFFDPITLGFFIDGDLEKSLEDIPDDLRLRTKSTLFHEFTHYLQFYGTTFGNTYLFHQWAALVKKFDFLRSLQGKIVNTPLSKYEDKSNFNEYDWIHMQSERYYQQELYGLTFPLFSNNPLQMPKNNYLLISSPLIVQLSTNEAYSIVGETVLENHAVAYEMMALQYNLGNFELATETLEKFYENLPKLEHNNYRAISQLLAKYELLHLEPIIYFVILNQAQIDNIAYHHSEYEIVRSLKRIIESFPYFKEKDIKAPVNNENIHEIVEIICNTCKLHCPFESLQKIRDLRKTEELTVGKAVSWVSTEVMTWFLENPFEALYWPKLSHPFKLKIPILNVLDENQKLYSFFNNMNPEDAKDLIAEHHNNSMLLYLVNSLLSKKQFKCPSYNHTKPSMSESCHMCSGYIPDDAIQEDCPYHELLISEGINLSTIQRSH